MRVKLWEETILDQTPENIVDLLESVGGQTYTIDFNEALGDTLKEKFEHVYVGIVNVCKHIHDASGKTANFLFTGPEVASMFEAGGAPVLQLPNESEKVGTQHTMNITGRWRLYKNNEMPADGKIYIGQTNESGEISKETQSMACLEIVNYFI